MVSSVQRWLTTALVALSGLASVAAAQSGQITGRVTDRETGSPIPDVRVEARGNGVIRNVLTTPSGTYRVGGLPAGTFTLNFSRVGYAQLAHTVTLGADATETADVTLSAVAVELNPTIISAGRTEEKALEAPASVSVVLERDIEETPALTLNDQIKAQPGVDMAQTGLVTNSTVTRGFNNVFSGAMLTLTDNRYAFVPSLRVNTSFLVPTVNEDVGRIEVLLGPASALYGPNSANGVMHVITKTPFESEGTTISLGAGTRSESLDLDSDVSEDFGDRAVTRGALRHAGTVGERFGYKLSGQIMQGQDWQFVDSAEPDSIPRYPGAPAGLCDSEDLCENRRDFDVERWSIEGRTDFRPNEQTDIILGAGASHAGSAIELTGIGAAQVNDWRYTYTQARARWNRLFAQVFLNMSDAGETFLLRTGQPIVDKSQMLVGQLQHGTYLGERIDLIYGIDAQKTDPRTEGTINGRNEDIDEITEIGAYLHSKTALTDRLDLFAAIRTDDHSELEDPVWSPRAAVVFKATDNHSVRFSYNRAFSTPSTNNLFLDIVAARIPVSPTVGYEVRALGVPASGFTFRRDCPSGVGGLCMRSPFAPSPTAFLPADATLLWQVATNVIFAQSMGQVDIRSAPAPTSAEVGTVLRTLNQTTRQFSNVNASDVTDIEPTKPTTNEVLEAGYRGLLGRKILLAGNVYYEKRTNFIGPLIVETPNVFFEAQSLATYIAGVLEASGYPPATAQTLGQQFGVGIGGVENTATTGVPLGTVSPEGGFADDSDLILTYRNFGDLDLYGADVAIDALLTDRWTLMGTLSLTSDDFFPQEEVGGLSDIALNAPKTRGSAGLRFRTDELTVQGRGRFAAGFPMNSGVYIGDVEGHTLFDFNVSYRIPFAANTLLTLDVQNAFNDQKQQFVGAPAIGRLVFLQAQYTFGARQP